MMQRIGANTDILQIYGINMVVDYEALVRGTMMDKDVSSRNLFVCDHVEFQQWDSWLIEQVVNAVKFMAQPELIVESGASKLSTKIWPRNRGIETVLLGLRSEHRYGVDDGESLYDVEEINEKTPIELWEELRAYLIRGYPNWEDLVEGVGGPESLMELVQGFEWYRDEDSWNDDGTEAERSMEEWKEIHTATNERFEERARKLIQGQKEIGYHAIHDMLYTEEKHAKLDGEKDRKLHVLIPIRVVPEFHFGLFFAIFKIKKLYKMGCHIHVLWMDADNNFERNSEEEMVDHLHNMERLIRRRSMVDRGKRGSGVIQYVRETTLRQRMNEMKVPSVKSHTGSITQFTLKEIRLASFYDLLIRRKPPWLTWRNSPVNPGGLNPNDVLVDKEIHSMVSTQLYNLYLKLIGGKSCDIIIQGIDRVIYDLETRRCLKEYGEIHGVSDDLALADVLYYPPMKGLNQMSEFVRSKTQGTKRIELLSINDEKAFIAETFNHIDDESVEQFANLLLPWVSKHKDWVLKNKSEAGGIIDSMNEGTWNKNIREELVNVTWDVFQDFRAILNFKEWDVDWDEIDPVVEPSEVYRRLRIFFSDQSLAHFTDVCNFLRRARREMIRTEGDWIEINQLRFGKDEGRHEQMVRRLRSFSDKIQSEFDDEEDLGKKLIGWTHDKNDEKIEWKDKNIISNNPLFCIRRDVKKPGKPMMIHVKESGLKLHFDWTA